MIARLPGIPFSSLCFFELRFFCVSSLGLCSWFIWLYSNASFCYLLMLHQSSFINICQDEMLKCGTQLACITCCMFMLVPFLSEDLWNTVYTYFDAIAWLKKMWLQIDFLLDLQLQILIYQKLRLWELECQSQRYYCFPRHPPSLCSNFNQDQKYFYNNLLLSYVSQHRKFDSDWKSMNLW